MKRLHSIRLSLLCGLALAIPAGAIQNQHLDVTAAVANTPGPQVTFSWDTQQAGITVEISRRELTETDTNPWQVRGSASHPTASFTDTLVPGKFYDYQVTRQGSGSIWTVGVPVVVTLDAALPGPRGELLLVVDNTVKDVLAKDLQLLESDMTGDGWTVRRLDFARHGAATPVALRTAITNEYAASGGAIQALYLFGHLPVVKSGYSAPDGHSARPMPADGYYGDMDGIWTDTQFFQTGVNVPGDGHFDQQSYAENPVELMVGRTDMADMPAYHKGEIELLRDYIHKSHAYRQGRRTEVPRRALWSGDTFLTERRWLVPLFGGFSNLTLGQFQPTLSTNPHLFAMDWGPQGGANALYTEYHNKAIFFCNFASGKLDWQSQNNEMRGLLAQTDWGLTCVWGGYATAYFQHMGVGLPIGNSIRRMNNIYSYGLFTTVMGDPTLRLHPMAVPSGVAVAKTGADAALTWQASPDPEVTGYHVYRSANRLGPYTRLTSTPVAVLAYTHATPPAGEAFYQVRAVKRELAAAAIYTNESQGAFARLNADGTANHAPVATGASFTILMANQPIPVTLSGTDADGDVLTPIITRNPAHGDLRWDGSQTTYVPDPSYIGSDSFAYVLTDGVAVSAPATNQVALPPLPAITQQPQLQSVRVGNSVSFTVAASGDPAPTFQWYKDSVLIDGATNATLTFAIAQLADAGSYHAVATNSLGSATSQAATLKILPAINGPTTPVDRTTAYGSGADAHVNSGNGNGNLGAAVVLENKAELSGTKRLPYLRFDLGGLPTVVSGATVDAIRNPSLSLTVASTTTGSYTYDLWGFVNGTDADRAATGGWLETGTGSLTWNNAPGRPVGITGDPAVITTAGTPPLPGTPSTYGILIGQFTVPTSAAETTVTFGATNVNASVSAGFAANLESFLLSDTNGLVSFAFQRTDGGPVVTTFHTKENLAAGGVNNPSFNPTLRFELVEPSGAPVITSPLAATGTVGTAFAYTITATNAPTGFAAAGLPTGLALDGVTGLISGVPVEARPSTVTLTATNALGSSTLELQLNIRCTVTASAAGGGSIAPSGTLTLSGGATQAFTMAAGPYATLSGVQVDGLPVGPVAGYTFESVRTNHTIHAVFNNILTSHGTPYGWLAELGWTSDFETADGADPDGDGVPNHAEYQAETDPSNPLSRPPYNTVPYAESFENLAGWGGGYTNVAGRMGWQSSDPLSDDSRIVKRAYDFATTNPPLPSATHTNVLQLKTEGAALFTDFGSGHSMTGALTYADMLTQIVASENAPTAYTSVDSGIKSGLFLDSNNRLCIYHGVAAADGAWVSNTVTMTDRVLSPTQWVRLTYAFDTTLVDGAPAMFQVRVDGLVITNGAAFGKNWKAHYASTGTLPSLSPDGSWFRFATAGAAATRLRKISFGGSGFLDDLVVSLTEPFPEAAGTFLLIVNRSGHGSSSLGAAALTSVPVPAGTATQIVYRADDWHRIATLGSNGVAVSAASGLAVYTQFLGQVSANVSNAVAFALATPTQTGYGAPTFWLTNWTEVGVAQAPADGFDVETKFILGLDPTASNTYNLAMDELTVCSNKVVVVVRRDVTGPLSPDGMHGFLGLQHTDDLRTSFTNMPGTAVTGVGVFDPTGRRAYTNDLNNLPGFYRAVIQPNL